MNELNKAILFLLFLLSFVLDVQSVEHAHTAFPTDSFSVGRDVTLFFRLNTEVLQSDYMDNIAVR